MAITAVAPVVSRLLGVLGSRLLMSVGPLLAAAGLVWIRPLGVDGNDGSDFWSAVVLAAAVALARAQLRSRGA